jgi:hypothetical protein
MDAFFVLPSAGIRTALLTRRTCATTPHGSTVLWEHRGEGRTVKNTSFRYQMMSVRHHTYLRKSYKEVVRIIYRREVI